MKRTMLLVPVLLLAVTLTGCPERKRSNLLNPNLEKIVESLNTEFGGYSYREIDASEQVSVEKHFYVGAGGVTHVVRIINGKVRAVNTHK